MKAAPFDYVRPASVQEAIRVLMDADGDGKIIAGGQSLAPVLAMRLARPKVLVDINRIPGLGFIDPTGDNRLKLGALVRHVDLLRQTHSPLLAAAANWIGHAAIRSRGTTGGSIAHADPSAELPVVVTALDAEISTAGPDGVRKLTADELFVGPLDTSLMESEMITGVEVAIPEEWGFAEFSRRHGDFGMVTVVAASIRGQWRITIGGVTSTPHRALEAESIMDGGPISSDRIAQAAAAAADIRTSSDIHATAEFRQAMTKEFTRRALVQATATATTGVR